ncbi:hypothetical protein F3Y22_tig00004072pilonHSYRG00109 [Hibiscus syriacus]|uniref:Uncharacterized protein n=1 Tax=Hibiscus syriacus TaxID=106335 RepID=A0A6A3CHY1_HIBSY|nr:hypothetical protein F3Y22_tig00004072pilonHSYRG00109 [Hibiscus syriacus]
MLQQSSTPHLHFRMENGVFVLAGESPLYHPPSHFKPTFSRVGDRWEYFNGNMNKLGNFANIFSQSLCTRPGFDGRRFSTWATEGKKKIVSRLVPGNHDSMDKYDGWREEFEAPFLLQVTTLAGLRL